MVINYQSFGGPVDRGWTHLSRDAKESQGDFEVSQKKALYPMGDGTQKSLELDGRVDDAIIARTKDQDNLITDLKAFQNKGRAALGPEWTGKTDPKTQATEYTSPDSPQTITFGVSQDGAETVKVSTPDSLGELTHNMNARLVDGNVTNVQEEVTWLFAGEKAFR